jgi:hypothetical protein
MFNNSSLSCPIEGDELFFSILLPVLVSMKIKPQQALTVFG